ncbi:MAG: ribonuclease HII [Patescibacteria group bacterium]
MRDYKKIFYIVGVDEVGRGPIAGPLAVGAVLIKLKTKNLKLKIFSGIKDSKKLNEEKREEWYRKITALQKEGILEYKVSFVSEKIIDKKGISYSLKLAVSNCLKRLSVGQKTKILLDGSLHAPDIYVKQKTIIRGDEKEAIIAAASIVAKVLRDRRMKRLAKKFPGYGFEVHKGYGTKAHYRILKKLDPSEIHRKSFL